MAFHPFEVNVPHLAYAFLGGFVVIVSRALSVGRVVGWIGSAGEVEVGSSVGKAGEMEWVEGIGSRTAENLRGGKVGWGWHGASLRKIQASGFRIRSEKQPRRLGWNSGLEVSTCQLERTLTS